MADKNAQNILKRALKKGDIKAFEKAYTLYYEKLCRYLLSYTQNRAQVEDVVQETFIALWRKRKNLHIKTSAESYLFRMAYNNMMDRFRKTSKKESFLMEYYHTALMRAEKQDDNYKKKQLKKLKNCIADLPNRCKAVFVESKLSKNTNQEVARKLNISLKTVEGHITKGYKLLKECMKQKM